MSNRVSCIIFYTIWHRKPSEIYINKYHTPFFRTVVFNGKVEALHVSNTCEKSSFHLKCGAEFNYTKPGSKNQCILSSTDVVGAAHCSHCTGLTSYLFHYS